MGTLTIDVNDVAAVVSQLDLTGLPQHAVYYSAGVLNFPDNLQSAVTAANNATALNSQKAVALSDYANAAQAKFLATATIQVNIGTSSAPQMLTATVDPNSLVLLNGAARMASSDSNFTVTWTIGTVSTTLSAAQILTIDAAVTTYVQGTFNTLASVVADIVSGKTTTAAQVDAIAWPASTASAS